MKNSFTQIAAGFFLAIFLAGWMVVYLPLFSSEFLEHPLSELTTKAESENSEKEKEEKIPEKNLINHGFDLQFHAWNFADGKNSCFLHKCRWLNVFLPILTPPPERA